MQISFLIGYWYRLLLILFCAFLLAVLGACSILFDAPPEQANNAEYAVQTLEKTMRERGETFVKQSEQFKDNALTAGRQTVSREIVFTSPDGITRSSRQSWPVMHIANIAPQHPPQLLLEGPVNGSVWLDERELGLVQTGSVRIVTLHAGEHKVRIEHPLMPAITAQFYIEQGERITLRWETR